MTNTEKRGQEILEQLCRTGNWAVDKKTGDIIRCNNCRKCLFAVDHTECDQLKSKWLKKRCDVEKRHFSEGDKAVLRVLDKVQWVATDADGLIFGFVAKPKKGIAVWRSIETSVCISSYSGSATFTDVKWTDEEPTSRAEILGEEK